MQNLGKIGPSIETVVVFFPKNALLKEKGPQRQSNCFDKPKTIHGQFAEQVTQFS